ncbi:Gas vesicle synthesis protein GvpL/GvpF [Halovivax ruber XH-70]|uniref:Gas vesicle synthesis protein GvpL/GvpF n=1 Tax=Halovivax ruber (strain DSM 18193 / JCM 13892 / XH-70) TaxID=797302 RepID=L0IEW8_HALRX|nr:GvpL/GvpF family gas vesicle protein [Halovivax ruber]AGB16517.1 Gas vesicle synthesis protein GvpL/GvpF [Halovivax ruber XH-70]
MTDEDRRATTTAASDHGLDEGRYLYCVVDLRGSDAGRERDAERDVAAFDVAGVDDEPVSIVTSTGERWDSGQTPERVEAGIGAVVHDCDELYDAADPRLLKRWLVQHQRVVDEATAQFDTPIPFQFDTILRGGDAGVGSWLESESETLRRALETVAGLCEYRIVVGRTEPIPTTAIVTEDDELAALESRIDAASEGTAHLLKKQYERQLDSRRRERDRQLVAGLEERLEPLVATLQPLDRRPSVSLADVSSTTKAAGGEESGTADGATDESAKGDEVTDDGEPVCRYAILAADDAIDEVGSLLDSVADRDGITVRFTGPWPPYSFVPAFDEDSDEPPRQTEVP